MNDLIKRDSERPEPGRGLQPLAASTIEMLVACRMVPRDPRFDKSIIITK
jgi:hypothetical protein